MDDALPMRAWYVRVDPRRAGLRLDVAVATDPDGRATTSSLARSHQAVVGVNAGFFRIREGRAVADDLLLADGTLRGDSDARRPALGIDAEGVPDVAWTTREDARTVELFPGEESADGYERPPRRQPSRPWIMEELVQGRPMLLAKGRPYKHWLVERHPRTAAGIDAEGHLILMVVDGRQSSSRGATLDELTFLMEEVGCLEALNLDGGGSTTLVLDGSLVNRPAGGSEEREVVSALLVLSI